MKIWSNEILMSDTQHRSYKFETCNFTIYKKLRIKPIQSEEQQQYNISVKALILIIMIFYIWAYLFQDEI